MTTRSLVSWKAGRDIEKQQDLFNEMVRAVMTYLLPTVLNRINAQLARGETVKIGDCTVSKTGVQFLHKAGSGQRPTICRGTRQCKARIRKHHHLG